MSHNSRKKAKNRDHTSYKSLSSLIAIHFHLEKIKRAFLHQSMEDQNPQLLNVLEALKQASHELQAHPCSDSIKALLELQTESGTILSKDPNLSVLSHHLSDLKTQAQTLHNSRGHSLTGFLSRRVSTQSISRVAGSIETEIQAWIDRESVEKLTEILKDPCNNEDKLVELLTHFEDRVLRGFNRELQDLVLKSKILSSLE